MKITITNTYDLMLVEGYLIAKGLDPLSTKFMISKIRGGVLSYFSKSKRRAWNDLVDKAHQWDWTRWSGSKYAEVPTEDERDAYMYGWLSAAYHRRSDGKQDAERLMDRWIKFLNAVPNENKFDVEVAFWVGHCEWIRKTIFQTALKEHSKNEPLASS